jgi:chaperonin cofactor prefoldin
MGLKEAYQEKIEAQLKEWTGKLSELKARADQAGADAKEHLEQQIERLRARQEALQQKLNEIKAAGADSWETLKTGTEKALDEMKKTWETLKARFHQ